MSDGAVDVVYEAFPDTEWEKFFYVLGEEIRNIVLERIANGECVDGTPLLTGFIDGYSPAYEEKKKKMGRDVYSPGDRFVLTGAMLGGFDVTDHGFNFVEIGFTDEELAARAYGNDQRRPTFSVTEEEVERAFQAAWLRIFGPPEE